MTPRSFSIKLLSSNFLLLIFLKHLFKFFKVYAAVLDVLFPSKIIFSTKIPLDHKHSFKFSRLFRNFKISSALFIKNRNYWNHLTLNSPIKTFYRLFIFRNLQISDSLFEITVRNWSIFIKFTRVIPLNFF